MKKDDDGLHVRQRIENRYRYTGYDGIDPGDLRGRMRWWGLYTQRAPGIDGGRTAVLEPEELEDKFFMMRVRIDGGQLTTSALRTIGEVSTKYARDTADLTDRQNVQLHWVRIEDVPDIWDRDRGCRAEHRRGLRRRAPGHPRFAGGRHRRPTKSSTAPPRCRKSCSASSAARNSPTCRANSRPPFPVRPGRTSRTRSTTSHSSASCIPSTAPASISGSAAACPPTRCSASGWVPGCRWTRWPDVWAGVISIFRDYGYRRLRNRARLKFLVADWGPQKFREVLETAVPQAHADRRPGTGGLPTVPATTSACTRRRTASSTSGSTRPSAGCPARLLTKIADWPRRTAPTGSGRPPTRAWSSSTSSPDRVDSLVAALDELGLSVKPSTFRRNMMACTGLEFCKLAIVETKARGHRAGRRAGDSGSATSTCR